MRVLIIDDEPNLRDSLREYCELEGLEADIAGNGLAAVRQVQEKTYDALVVDLKMPEMSGLEFLSWLKESGPSVPAVMMSAFGEVQDAVEAMRRGAVDYLVKPFEPEELTIRLKKIIADREILRQVSAQPRIADSDYTSGNTLMREALSLMDRAAPSDATILVTGESGTGKEISARYIHRRSRRSEGPFVPINIGGIPEALLESELFGYEKGAFTGADKRKQGLFELAEAGTLFLDELGELSGALQVKLLRVIQERKLQRLGGTTLIPIDVRIVAATNRDLEQRVKEGLFREDLFYRLNVIHVRLPSLRERREDLPSLTGKLLSKIAEKLGIPSKQVNPDVLKAMTGYSFPGNIRELENMLERACILTSDETLTIRDFPRLSEMSESGHTLPVGTLKEMEIRMIREALLRNEGHRERTAEELGITRRTLLNKMKDYGLDWDEMK